MTRVEKTDNQWRQQLSPEQYRVLRQSGTERAGSGALEKNERLGIYRCAGCRTELFSSAAKFDSGSGWPSFDRPSAPESITSKSNRVLLLRRTEALCAVCDGHLGHAFGDGPTSTGQRYCINSAALIFDEEEHSQQGTSTP